jgi:hypothetical protein
MSARELQQACRDRGLPTARDKDTMVARLLEAGAASGPHLHEGERVLSGPAARATQDEVADLTGLVPAVPAVHREQFPARDDGPDDTEHAACRAATITAAHAAGHATMGDAYRTGTVNGMWVYEVHLRRGLA